MGMSAMVSAVDVPSGGTISIAILGDEGTEAASPEPFVDAATRALADKGFTLLDDGHAAFVMQLSVRSSEVGTGSGKVATGSSDLMNGGVAGAVGSSFRVPIPSGKTHHVALERTEVEMSLRKRGEDKAIWRGTAVTVRPADARAAAASDLCNALLRAYPAQPEAVIGVP